ncbi:Uncharacterized protein dnm_016750 [Desulfonema magnum]|uniref:Uncharacterized protein n=1 Tax=Desulfonema magnum TaxID=45655 RepID=A0A975GLD6_9BACT|nr:Uncharacterized protein dnm_016750 [Desulfonema magnum]
MDRLKKVRKKCSLFDGYVPQIEKDSHRICESFDLLCDLKKAVVPNK